MVDLILQGAALEEILCHYSRFILGHHTCRIHGDGYRVLRD
jgi:hypothetical protein